MVATKCKTTDDPSTPTPYVSPSSVPYTPPASEIIPICDPNNPIPICDNSYACTNEQIESGVAYYINETDQCSANPYQSIDNDFFY
jgi:hypothetical protein